jgi:hypothetical protein
MTEAKPRVVDVGENYSDSAPRNDARRSEECKFNEVVSQAIICDTRKGRKAFNLATYVIVTDIATTALEHLKVLHEGRGPVELSVHGADGETQGTLLTKSPALDGSS